MKLHFHAKELKKLDDGTYSKKKYSKILAERLQDRFDYIRESESGGDLTVIALELVDYHKG